MAHLALYIVKSSNAMDMEDYSVYQIKTCCDRQCSQDNSVLAYLSLICILNLDLWLLTQLYLQLMNILHKIGLDSSSYV